LIILISDRYEKTQIPVSTKLSKMTQLLLVFITMDFRAYWRHHQQEIRNTKLIQDTSTQNLLQCKVGEHATLNSVKMVAINILILHKFIIRKSGNA